MRIILAAGFCVLLATFVGLGLWQLDRAEQKRELFGAFETGSTGDAATALIDGDALVENRYRRLELRGKYLSSKQILLDWMTHEGRVGYQVLTPFRPADSEKWIVVNRGWLQGSADHSELPNLDVDEGDRIVSGRIDALPSPGLRLDTPRGEPSASWPRALLYPTLEEIEAELGLSLARYQLLLDAGEPDGYLREWQPRSLPPTTHMGYAAQWFGFAMALIVIAAVLVIRSARQRARDGSTSA